MECIFFHEQQSENFEINITKLTTERKLHKYFVYHCGLYLRLLYTRFCVYYQKGKGIIVILRQKKRLQIKEVSGQI